jgi:anti-sigma regulatory factor (Ser/Thr protein kinase)
MMAELCLHIIDLAENSVRAEAKEISIRLLRSESRDILELEIGDDGCGMDEETAIRVQDPFYTTKGGKKVGLGIPLLKAAAEMTEGAFHLVSKPGMGTTVLAVFRLSHIDTPPVGALSDTLFTLLVAHEGVNFKVQLTTDQSEFTLSTADIREQVGDMPLTHPDILAFLRVFISENLSELGF